MGTRSDNVLEVRDRSLITGEGGGLVQKRGGSDIFVHEKRGGGQKFLCNINTYLPGVTLPYHKTNK